MHMLLYYIVWKQKAEPTQTCLNSFIWPSRILQMNWNWLKCSASFSKRLRALTEPSDGRTKACPCLSEVIPQLIKNQLGYERDQAWSRKAGTIEQKECFKKTVFSALYMKIKLKCSYFQASSAGMCATSWVLILNAIKAVTLWLFFFFLVCLVRDQCLKEFVSDSHPGGRVQMSVSLGVGTTHECLWTPWGVLSLTAEAWERSASTSTTCVFGFSSVKQLSECTQSWTFGPPGLAGTTEQVCKAQPASDWIVGI